MAHRVVALAYDGLCTFEFGITAEVFALPRPELDRDWYDFAVAGVEPGPLRALGGITVDVDGGMDLLGSAETIVIPGWRDAREHPPDELVDALRDAHASGARIVTICSGVFVLAATGLLDGRPATTHWRYEELFRRMHPAVDLRPDVLYIDDGDLLTSAGSAAGIDLCVHIVRLDHGAEVATSVARRLVVPPHRDGGQAQFVPGPLPPSEEGPTMAAVMDWALARLDEPMTVADLADQAHMSERSFLRRFKAETGSSPHRWVTRQRVHHAQHLLETTGHPIEHLAVLAGFGSAESLRVHFRRIIGTSPSAYRRSFTRR